MRRVAALLLLIGCGVAAACGRDPAPPTIVFVGDSITAASIGNHRYDSDGGFVGRIATRAGTRARIVRRGIGGATTHIWLTPEHTKLATRLWPELSSFARSENEPLVEYVLRYDAPIDVVVILLGTNDVRLEPDAWPNRAEPLLSTFIDGLVAVHDAAATYAARVLVGTIPPIAGTPEALIAAANDRIRARFDDVIPIGEGFRAAGGTRLLADGIHPDATGYDVIARIVAEDLTTRGLLAPYGE